MEFGGRVGIRKGSEEIAALACAGRVKATISLNIGYEPNVQLQLVELQLMLPPGGINPPREFLGSPPLEQLIAQNSLEAIRSIKLSLIDLPSG